MSQRQRGLLIMDASVLIDLCTADPSVSTLISEHIGQVHVPLPLLREEIDQLTESDCTDLGIVAVEPSLAVAAEAAERRAGLSFHDRVCLLLAREKGWTCVTNDRALRRACADEGVPVLWGLEAIALLVDLGALPSPAAAELGHAIRAANPAFITERILTSFLERIARGAPKRKRKSRKRGEK
jgi:rRNA-processing protein FCF1